MLESLFNNFAELQSEILFNERLHHGYFSMKTFYLKNTFLTAETVVRRCSKKGVLRNIAKFTGKYLCHRVFLNKVAGLRPATLLKKTLWHWYFLVNFVKFLRTPFFYRTPPVAASVTGHRRTTASDT